ncbi:MAG: Yip1 family protein [Oscillochloridaceae bacterium umkhey_bin13]
MFQEMINASIAVLTKPSVATFEEYEKDNLQWALIYSVAAALINAVFAAISALLSPELYSDTFSQLGLGVVGGVLIAMFAFVFTIIGTVLGLLITWGITFGLGRAFGGTGTFGELAYGLALFGAPLTIASSILGLIPFLGGLVNLVLVIYNFYLTYLAIQSGMNLPNTKALFVIIIQAIIGIVLLTCFFVLVVFGVAAGGGLAP